MKSNLGGWFMKYVSVDKIFDFEFHCIDAMSEDSFFTVSFTFKGVTIEWNEYKKEFPVQHMEATKSRVI